MNKISMKMDFLHYKAGDVVTGSLKGTKFVSDTGIMIPVFLFTTLGTPPDIIAAASPSVEEEPTTTPKRTRRMPMKPGLILENNAGLIAFLSNPSDVLPHSTLTKFKFEDKTCALSLPEGVVSLSMITNGRLPTSKRDYVVPVFADNVFNEAAKFHIPQVDKEYYWNPDVLEVLILAHTLNQKLLLTGLPGTGKSSACEQFAAWIKQPFLRVQCQGNTEAPDLTGNWVANPEGMQYQLAPLALGLRDGYLICMDEVFKLPAHVQMVMQSLYESGGYLSVPDMPGSVEDKIIRPHLANRIFATDNVKGTGDNFDKFAATQLQDSSSLDRFTMTHTVDYLPEVAEIKMLQGKFSTVSSDMVKKIVKIANLVREGYKQGKFSVTLSGGRGLATICMLTDAGITTKQALDICYGNKLGDDTEVAVFKSILQAVGV